MTDKEKRSFDKEIRSFMAPFGFNTPESPKDYRDIKFSDIAQAQPVPAKFFIDVANIPVLHQYKRGSCVAHATTSRKMKIEETDSGKVTNLSPRFMYSVIKKLDGNDSEGTAIRNGLKVLKEYGVCTEETYPSDYPEMSHAEFMDYSKIPKEAFEEAKKFKDSSYASVAVDKEAFKQALVTGVPILVRVVIDERWWSPSWRESDILPLRPAKNPIGGHAVWIYGYDGDRFYGRNSWGNTWGSGGNFYFDWANYSTSITEAWTSIDIDNDKLEEVHNLPKPAPLTLYMFYGVWGNDVKRLQTVLKVTPVSGWFGPKTREAVKAYQAKNGIEQTGTVGPITRAALNKEFFS